MWWILIVTPALSLAIQISNGYLVHSADEAYGGLAPDGLLVLIAVLLATVILFRVLVRWRGTARLARAEALAAALAVIPLLIEVAGIAALVGWPHTRTASPLRFTAAALLVLAWTALVLYARHRLRFRGLGVMERL
jgi:hypothetical protein